MTSDTLKINVTDKLFRLQIIFQIYIFKQDLASNNLQELILYKTNQLIFFHRSCRDDDRQLLCTVKNQGTTRCYNEACL